MKFLQTIHEGLAYCLGRLLVLMIYGYRYSLSFLMGRHCRHEPSCSLYAIEAIELNGVWKGCWLMIARLWRCGPFGSHGYDPVPDLREVRYPFYQAWRYGVWRRGEAGRAAND